MSLTFIIASCNREEQAFSTAQSLLDTGICNVVLVDDGSKTPYQYQKFHKNLTLLRLPVNSGPSAARNHGAHNTQTDWLIFLDDDDCLDSNLFKWIKRNKSNSLINLDVVYFGYREINIENKSNPNVIISSSKKPSVLSGSWMMRRSFFSELGGYEERLRYSENTDLIERATRAGARTLHTGIISLAYTVGRPKRREEMAKHRAEACLFYLKNRSNHDRKKTLKIGLINSWWNKNFSFAIRLVAAFLLQR